MTTTAEQQPRTLDAGDGRRIAYRHTPGRAPGVLFCGGFRSDMTGTKARTLEQHCLGTGRAYTRFDYTGHGTSSGRFEDGTIGGWTDDALAVIDRVARGPLVLVGSSMGGWIMLLAALARRHHVRGLVGVASAPDYTEDLLWTPAPPAVRFALATEGRWLRPSAYSEEPDVITQHLIDEGRRHLVLRGPIPLTCPVHLLHGQRDADVPWRTSLKLAERLESEDVTLELIKDGDHRLSRPKDLARICAAVERVAESAAGG